MRSLRWLRKNGLNRYWLKTLSVSILHSIMLNLASKTQHWVREEVLGLVSRWSHIISFGLRWCISFPIPINTYKAQECKKPPPEPSKLGNWVSPRVSFSSHWGWAPAPIDQFFYFNKLPIKSRSAVGTLISIPTTTDKGDFLPLLHFNRWFLPLAFANLWQIFLFCH